MNGWCVVQFGICNVGIFIGIIVVNIGFRNVGIVFERVFCFLVFNIIKFVYRIYVLMDVVDFNWRICMGICCIEILRKYI